MQVEGSCLKLLSHNIKKYKESKNEDDLPELNILYEVAQKADEKSEKLNYRLFKEIWSKKQEPDSAQLNTKNDRDYSDMELNNKIKCRGPSKIVEMLKSRREEYLKKLKESKVYDVYDSITRKDLMAKIRTDPLLYRNRLHAISSNSDYTKFIIKDIQSTGNLPLMMINKCKESSRNKYQLKIKQSKTEIISKSRAVIPSLDIGSPLTSIPLIKSINQLRISKEIRNFFKLHLGKDSKKSRDI